MNISTTTRAFSLPTELLNQLTDKARASNRPLDNVIAHALKVGLEAMPVFAMVPADLEFGVDTVDPEQVRQLLQNVQLRCSAEDDKTALVPCRLIAAARYAIASLQKRIKEIAPL